DNTQVNVLYFIKLNLGSEQFGLGLKVDSVPKRISSCHLPQDLKVAFVYFAFVLRCSHVIAVDQFDVNLVYYLNPTNSHSLLLFFFHHGSVLPKVFFSL
uniref:Uncharacterized protein n=1 Tax=Electrophorus electricus TaxID=8005 RepID=A0A4W4GS48_ELEEL